MKKIIITIGFLSFLLFSSCETEQARQKRLADEEQQRIEYAEQRAKVRSEREKRLYEERWGKERTEDKQANIQQEVQIEQSAQAAQEVKTEQQSLEDKENEVFKKYLNNSLQTGTTPYRRYYGGNSSCKESECSQIKVTSPNDADVLVILKTQNKVVRHAYIRSGSFYIFEIPNGTYQPFFYYGKGWNPEKEIKQANGATMLGGFISNESFRKDSPQQLDNNMLEYILILQPNGNYTTSPSSLTEMF